MMMITLMLLGFSNFQGETIADTVSNVDIWLKYNPDGANITYEPHRLPQSPEQTLTSGKGDCTDIALLARVILTEYHIKTRLVSGYAGGELHDWYEYKNETGDWNTFESLYFNNLTIVKYDKIW